MAIKKYYTGLATPIDEKFPKILKGKGFTISFEKYDDTSITYSGGKIIPHKNIVIACNSYEKACDIAQLIYECDVIIRGGEFPIRFYPIETVQEIKKNFKPQNRYSYNTTSLRSAVRMVAKASYSYKYIWTIHKLFLSYHLVSVPFVELEPSYKVIDKPTLRKYLPSINIVTKASSIIMAYWAIEELGFHTPASKKFEIWERNNKNKLIKELKKKKINQNEKFIWSLRGPVTYLEKELPGFKEFKFQKTRWSRGNVRDIEIDIPEAIYFASFLRSKVCAHVFSSKENKKRIRTLSVYEVCNIQDLARELLLYLLGLRVKDLY